MGVLSLTWAVEREERERRRARERGFVVIVFGSLVMKVWISGPGRLVKCATGANGSFFCEGNVDEALACSVGSI